MKALKAISLIGSLVFLLVVLVNGGDDKSHTVTLQFKEQLWDLEIDLPGFEIHQSAPDKLQAENKETKIMITVTLESAAQEGDATICRDYYAEKLKRSPLPQDDIKTSEKGEMARREYMIKEFGGATLNQKNLNAYLVYQGIWIDIHLSKLNWQEENMKEFETILDTVRFEELSPNILISSDCDLKKVETVLECSNCNKLLTCFSCPKCSKEKRNGPERELKENEESVINAQCAECGGPMAQSVRINSQGNCAACKRKPEKPVLFCIKYVYRCPDHPTFQVLKPGSCNELITDEAGDSHKCSKKLELYHIVYSPIIYVYECPKCKEKTPKPGKCEACQQKRVKKKICLSSGKYPHINEADLPR